MTLGLKNKSSREVAKVAEETEGVASVAEMPMEAEALAEVVLLSKPRMMTLGSHRVIKVKQNKVKQSKARRS